MPFTLGKHSLKELNGVHPDLVTIVQRAIEITVQDFAVHDGLRTLEDQKKLLERGASQTLNSRHITGHAVDLVPYINGKLRWELEPMFDIAEAMRTAALELNFPLIWGGAWHIELTKTSDSPEDLVTDYITLRREQSKKPFVDGAHFELPRSIYPT